jgi:DNA-binding NarL/FixJ family response regulator
MAERIRVVIVDDHAAVREGLKALLDSHHDIEVGAEAGSGPEALERVLTVCPSVVLMDVSMPGWSGVTTTRRILELCPDTRIIAVSRHDDSGVVQGMLAAGAAGYVQKQNAPRELIDTIRAVAAGRRMAGPAIDRAPGPGGHAGAAESREDAADAALTEREQRVLLLVAKACSNEQIAQLLSISEDEAGAVKNEAMRKAGLASRIQVVGYAQRRGWIE